MKQHNFGLEGQLQFDNFLCGKKCRRRKKEKQGIRSERRKTKNDARRADTERVRAETRILLHQNLGAKEQVRMPMTGQQVSAPVMVPQPAPAPQPQKAGVGSNPLIIVVGVLLLGGIVMMGGNKQRKGQAPTVPMVPPVPIPQA